MRTVHAAVTFIEPWGILLAIVGLFFAWSEIAEDRAERRQDRHLHEATLFVLASEMLQKAREIDSANDEAASAQIGQVRALEKAVSSGISLEGINAHLVRLDHGDFTNGDFSHSNLSGATFLGTTFSRANLRNALLSRSIFRPADNRGQLEFPDLSETNLTDARLINTQFWFVNLKGANFSRARLDGAEFVGVDLTDVIYLTKQQLSKACGVHVTLPQGWSIDECE